MADRKPTPDILAAAQGDVLGDVLSGKPAPDRELIPIAKVRVDGGTQMRAALNEDTVKEYAEEFNRHHAWGDFPPVVLFYDGTDYWVGDGFHRVEAFKRVWGDRNPTDVVHAHVRPGSRRDAVLFAAGANASHGLRRTNADKRRAVETLLRDAEWSKWSDSEIARRCNVSQPTVGSLRASLINFISENGGSTQTERSYTTKHGTLATMNTANIGTTPKQGHHVAVAPAPQPGKVAYWVPEPSDPDYETETVVISEASGSRQKNAELAKCVVCHRPLSDPASAVAGVGPCCAAKRAAAAAGGGDVDTDEEEQPEDDGRKPLWQWTEEDWAAYEASKQPEPEKPQEPAEPATAQPVSLRDGYDSNEWYTPEEYIESVRSVMGGIDLDPASCELAQTVIKAGAYLTKDDDGLSHHWMGERVWLNPPYGKPDPWVEKLIAEFDDGTFVRQAMIVLNNMTETGYFQALLARFPVCVLKRRIQFWRHDQSGEAGRQGQVIFYLGPNIERFVEVFRALGPILGRIDE